jgi:lysophospholipid acyltransferase
MTYFFMKFYGRKVSAIVIVAITITHLSFIHIYRMVTDWGGWSLEVTTIYMMSLCKFSSIAFNYEDGGKDDSEIKSSYHRSKKIVERPSLLETFGFVFYFPSSLCGPSFEFIDFKKFVELTGEYENIPQKQAFKKAGKEFLQALACMAFTFKCLPIFDLLYCASDDYGNRSMAYKVIIN